jgi:short subunit dehydrogenase-like uncharacterized protein
MFRETMSFPFIGAIAMSIIAVGIIPILGFLLKFRPFHRLLSSILPQSGSGPSREAINKGGYELQIIATAETEPYDTPVRVRGIVRGT